MNYKLLALDVDGTLVREHTNTPTEPVVRVIKKAKNKIYITLVSARAWEDQKLIVNLLGLTDNYHVIENGTKVISPFKKLEYNKYISLEEAKQVLGKTHGLFTSVGFCVNGQWLSRLPTSHTDTVATISFIASSRKNGDVIQQIIQKLPKKYSITVGAHWSEPKWTVTLVSHKDASKGTGLHYIQKKLGITPKETIAVGDGASDVPMMKYAVERIAMGNAEPELKRIATYIAPPVSEDGLIDIINNFVLFSSS